MAGLGNLTMLSLDIRNREAGLPELGIRERLNATGSSSSRDLSISQAVKSIYGSTGRGEEEPAKSIRDTADTTDNITENVSNPTTDTGERASNLVETPLKQVPARVLGASKPGRRNDNTTDNATKEAFRKFKIAPDSKPGSLKFHGVVTTTSLIEGKKHEIRPVRIKRSRTKSPKIFQEVLTRGSTKRDAKAPLSISPSIGTLSTTEGITLANTKLELIQFTPGLTLDNLAGILSTSSPPPQEREGIQFPRMIVSRKSRRLSLKFEGIERIAILQGRTRNSSAGNVTLKMADFVRVTRVPPTLPIFG